MKDNVSEAGKKALGKILKRHKIALGIVKKGAKGLATAVSDYEKSHREATKGQTLVPLAKHNAQVNKITKSRERLAKQFAAVVEIEQEYRDFFRR